MLIKKVFLFYVLVLSLICFYPGIYAQTSTYWVDPNRGQKIYRKTAIIQANQVQSIFGNWGIFGKGDSPYSGVWPKGTKHAHVVEMTMLAASEVVGTDGNTYHVISESYSGNPNRAPDGHEYWWNPLPGYANDHRSFTSSDGTVDTTSQIAHSADATTWPASWPGRDANWNGTWNGYFGQNQFNADDEGYYVIDDFWNDKYPFYPFANDSTRRGLGLQCETRLFAWAHPLAQDQIFIHFRVTNTSTTNYSRDNRPIFFGAFADVNPGGMGSTSDMDAYDIDESMIISFAYNNIGIWTTYTNVLPGYMAWKFLESPGLSDDGIDNDHDGLIDERRDNDAGSYIFGSVGTYNGGAPCSHWSGDENGNWNPDLDDVGSDGIGPFDVNYKGPDVDGTEGNGRPDQGEPDFGFLDKDESDQIGLTSFTAPAYGSIVIKNENSIWAQIQPNVFVNPVQNANLLWVFASGAFDLAAGQTERFSTVWIFGPDNTTIYRNAITSQNIYNYNYKFTKPPIAPIVHAVAGSNRVTLYWDNRAEKSISPVYGKNFEGYMVVRGTDSQLSDAKIISDALGDWTYYKPIAQFDYKDGIYGASPIASGSELGAEYSKGIQFYLGSDNGLQYSYTDTTVTNGVTYYYAVLSYDRGYYDGMDTILINRGFLKGTDRHLVSMEPAYSPFSFTYDNYNQLVAQSTNTAIVTPNSRSTDYVAGTTSADGNGYVAYSSGPNQNTTGKVKVSVIDPGRLANNNKYEISFADSLNLSGEHVTYAYSVKNTIKDTTYFDSVAVPIDSTLNSSKSWSTTIFDGMTLSFQNVAPNMPYILAHSGWTEDRPENLQVNILKGAGWNTENFTLEVTDAPADYEYKKTNQVYFKIYDNITQD
ncbi:MAG: hypothetical protein P4L45_09235, partial [Ignavibacteriaceae bacterium]|nr:hypothetical protein [Ignavibacteriaceae bacterium]